MKRLLAMLTGVSLVLVAACSGVEDADGVDEGVVDEGSTEDLDEELGQAEQATWGQSGCISATFTDVSPYTHGRSEPMGPDPWCSTTFQAYTSPGTTYTNTNCTGDYIVEITGATGRTFDFGINYKGTMLETPCELGFYRTELTVWKQAPSSLWIQQGKVKYQSSGWSAFGGCFFSIVDGADIAPIVNSTYDKVRLSGRAWFPDLFTGVPQPQRVEMGVQYGTGPC
jgi:hypothetical protein